MAKKRGKHKHFNVYFFVGMMGIFCGMLLGIIYEGGQSNLVSGAVVVQNGQLNQMEAQQKGNPNYGALSGTLTFIISETKGQAISTDPGANFVLYFSRHNIEDWDLVKTDSDSYSGTLTGVDADNSGSTCTNSDYSTIAKYYDTNNNDVKNTEEKEIYAITTDSSGCFAVKMPPGRYDIYG